MSDENEEFEKQVRKPIIRAESLVTVWNFDVEGRAPVVVHVFHNLNTGTFSARPIDDKLKGLEATEQNANVAITRFLANFHEFWKTK